MAVDRWAVTFCTARTATWAGPQPAQVPVFAVPNVTAHPSTVSVPITVLLYNGPLLCGFNVPIKGLKDKYGRVADVGLSSVRCPSHGHISKTEQDRPIVTMRNYNEVGVADSVAAFRFSTRRLLGDILVSSTKYIQTLIRRPVWLGVRPQLLSTEQIIISPPVLSTVINGVRRSEPVVHIHRPLWWRRSRNGVGPAAAFFRSAIFLF